MAWKSPGMTHLWCPKCNKQYATDAELVLKDGKVVYKWKCQVCGSENFSEG
jgi:transcription elongation factor Elf1